MRIFVCAAALLGLAGVLWHFRPRPAWRPNIALIVLDTLRADHLGAYGSSRATSPALDALSRRGALFSQAYAQASWTKPSVASILTSHYPTAHQALAGRAVDAGSVLSIDPLNEELWTLPEALEALGYQTACLQTNPNVKREYGFAQGCGHYEFFEKGHDQAAEVTLRAVDWLNQGREQPFFLYAHYMDAHLPYTPPPPYDHVYTEPASTLDQAYNVETYRSIYQGLLNENLGVGPAPQRPTPGQLEHWIGLYDAEIAAMDRALDGLLHRLLSQPDTWILVIADHGEQLYDHGLMGHGQALHQELIRVPWIWVGPRVPAGRLFDRPVQLIDLFPSLLDALNARAGASSLQGRSLWPLLQGQAWQDRPVFAEVDDSRAVQTHPLRAVLDGRWKLVDEEFRGDAPARRKRFDLFADPGERSPTWTPDQRLMDLLEARGRADRLRASELPPTHRVPMDAETLRQLKSLGYIQ